MVNVLPVLYRPKCFHCPHQGYKELAHVVCVRSTLPALPVLPPPPAWGAWVPHTPLFKFKAPRCMPLPSIATLGRRSVANSLFEAGEVQKQGPQGSGSGKKMRHRDGHRMETVYRCAVRRRQWREHDDDLAARCSLTAQRPSTYHCEDLGTVWAGQGASHTADRPTTPDPPAAAVLTTAWCTCVQVSWRGSNCSRPRAAHPHRPAGGAAELPARHRL